MLINYKDTATFYTTTTDEYGRNKIVTSTNAVSVVFLQSIKIRQSGSQETLEADAICYPDPLNSFVIDNYYRLEGMYILAPLFSIDSDEGWYKVSSATVNRDHLLGNTIDNIQLLLKKSEKLLFIS